MLRKIYIDRVLKNRIFKNKVLVNDDVENLVKLKVMSVYDKKIKNVFLNKRSYLSQNLLGRRIFVHNGREFVSLKILPSMIGYKVGEFFYNKKNKIIKK